MKVSGGVSLAVALLFSASTGMAAIKCGPAKADRVTNQGKVYSFGISQTCTITTTGDVDLAQVKKRYAWYKDYSTKIHKVRKNVHHDGMQGARFRVTQVYKTSHGTLTVQAKNFYVSNADQLLLDSKSSSVSGTRDTKYARSVSYQVRFTKLSGGKVQMHLAKQTRVRKPSIPFITRMFKNANQKGLRADMKAMVSQHGKRFVAALN